MLEKLQEYINARLALMKLDIVEKTSKGIAFLVVAFVITTLVILFLLFVSIALSFFLGEKVGSTWGGFLIVAGIYLFVFLVFMAFKRFLLEKPLLNYLVRYLFDKVGDDEE